MLSTPGNTNPGNVLTKRTPKLEMYITKATINQEMQSTKETLKLGIYSTKGILMLGPPGEAFWAIVQDSNTFFCFVSMVGSSFMILKTIIKHVLIAL